MQTQKPAALAATPASDISQAYVNVMKDEELTLDVILDYFVSLTSFMDQLGKEAAQLLEKEFLTESEWRILNKKCFILWQHFERNRSMTKLWRLVIEKGIASLIHETEKAVIDSEKLSGGKIVRPFWDWFIAISYQLEPGARFGVGSHNCTVDVSRNLLESLINYAKLSKSKRALQIIAQSRFPGDTMAQALFIDRYRYYWGS